MLLLVAYVLVLYLVITIGLPAVVRLLARRAGTARLVALIRSVAFGELGVLAAWCEPEPDIETQRGVPKVPELGRSTGLGVLMQKDTALQARRTLGAGHGSSGPVARWESEGASRWEDPGPECIAGSATRIRGAMQSRSEHARAVRSQPHPQVPHSVQE
ncbi:MAG: hypothetical protein QOF33_960 [Thermomicrobiales bacterium]|nr:hypothetical protein [Thermomicrobiales bacterium]MEA2523811.1 hypothetical protein [Thermomicrobiales bacterium]MEA2582875.1 hypothetical protein [Thermomicrobiales bacterium]MEA2595850.1 hypothetical protein [Thermomicrobiales bacterium]